MSEKITREKQFKNADRLKLLRITMRLSQVALCDILGTKYKVKQSFYCRMEKGTYPMRKGFLEEVEVLYAYWVLEEVKQLKQRITYLENIHINKDLVAT